MRSEHFTKEKGEVPERGNMLPDMHGEDSSQRGDGGRSDKDNAICSECWLSVGVVGYEERGENVVCAICAKITTDEDEW